MYPNNPDGSIANFIIYPLDIGWELYLHEDMSKYGKIIERCLAVTETINQMIGFLEKKLDGLQGNDILINLNNIESNNIFQTYLWIIPQMDGTYALFEDFGASGRNFLDEDYDIDELISRHKEENIIISF